MHIPYRLAILGGLIADTNKEGNVPLNAKVWEGQSMVDAYNALAEQRDELAAALREIVEGHTTCSDSYSFVSVKRELIEKARLVLAKVSA